MDHRPALDEDIARMAGADPLRQAAAQAVLGIVSASLDIADLIAAGDPAGRLGRICGRNVDGDAQKTLDLEADALVRKALCSTSLAAYLSEESLLPESVDRDGLVAVAVDPLDGSSNFEANMCMGTIFSILPMTADPARVFSQPGSAQIAAGFVSYGPQTALALSLGEGVGVYVREPGGRSFRLVRERVRVPRRSHEFAINMSNQRHWDPPIRAYVEDCLAGAYGGPAANMRWIGSLVADAYRILTRGGIFLYPADGRAGYGEGRLRLLYEAHPMAFLMEQAGGAASTGRGRILDLAARDPHQRVPLIMGSAENVRAASRLHEDSLVLAERNAPLFANRGLFRV